MRSEIGPGARVVPTVHSAHQAEQQVRRELQMTDDASPYPSSRHGGGWVHLVVGLIVAFAGWGLLSGQTLTAHGRELTGLKLAEAEYRMHR
jgi:hypothetical protein